MKFFIICLLSLLITRQSQGDEAKAPNPTVPAVEMLGKFGFVWVGFRGALPRCKKIDNKIIQSFANDCQSKSAANSPAGQLFYECRSKSGKKATLVFQTEDICREEQETMAANGDGP